MMERPTLSTRGGDRGETGLFGGRRISKTHPRIHAYGTVDELNAVLGLVLAEKELSPELRAHCTGIQKMLFTIGADLAAPGTRNQEPGTRSIPRVTKEDVERLEYWGVGLEQTLPELKHFILPSGSRVGSLLHLARTVCRRAERWVVELKEEEPVNEHVLMYLNRLSDFLFLAARSANKEADVQETEWIPGISNT